MSKKKKIKERTQYEVIRSIRGDWGQVKPYTRIEDDKRFKKPKRKKGWMKNDSQRTNQTIEKNATRCKSICIL